MKLAIMFCALSLTTVAASVAVGDAHGEAAAESAAVAWLALIDAARYGESWNAAATLFRRAIPQEQWQSKAGRARNQLGAQQSRKLQSATFRSTLPGAPDGEYVVIQFTSSFAKKAQAFETVTAMKDEDGTWRVSGYYIK